MMLDIIYRAVVEIKVACYIYTPITALKKQGGLKKPRHS